MELNQLLKQSSTDSLTPSASVASFDADDEPPPTASRVYGSRFSKSPEERERMLMRRKEDLLKAARNCFLAKQRKQLPAPSPASLGLEQPPRPQAE